MKKLITLLLALAMVLSLTACGEQPTGATGDDGNTVSAAAPCTRPPYSWPATAIFPAASRA